MNYSDDYDRSDDEQFRRPRNNYDDEFDDVSFRRRSLQEDDLPHSRFGIASFILALVVGAFEFIVVVIAGWLTIKAGGDLDENSPEAILLGLCLLALQRQVLSGATYH